MSSAGPSKDLLDAERELVVRREQLEALARQALADAERIDDLERKLQNKKEEDRRKRQIFESQHVELEKLREDNTMLTDALKKLATELEKQRHQQEEAMRAFEGQGELAVRKLQMEVAVLQEELEEAKKQNRQAESTTHSSTFSKLRKEREELQVQLDEQSRALARAQAETSLKSQEAERGRKDLQEAREQMEKLSLELNGLRKESLDAAEEREEASQVSDELARAKDELNQKESKVRNFQRAVQAVEEQKHGLQEKLEKTEKDLAKQKSRVRKLVSDMALATTAAEDARARVNELEEKTESMQMSLKTAETEARVATGGDRAAKQLRKQLEEKEQELADLQKDRDSLRTQYYNMKAGVQSMQNAMTERSQGYENRLDEMRKQMDGMQTVAAELRTMAMQVKLLNTERDSAAHTIARLATKMDQIEGRARRGIARAQGLPITEEE